MSALSTLQRYRQDVVRDWPQTSGNLLVGLTLALVTLPQAVAFSVTLAGVPPHSGYFGLRAVSPGGWFIAPGCQLRAGETYADHANHLSYGGVALWSLELGRRHPDGWGVSLGIQNIFDSETIASTSGVLDRAANPAATAIFLPAAGRTVSLRLNYNW